MGAVQGLRKKVRIDRARKQLKGVSIVDVDGGTNEGIVADMWRMLILK
jgi:hypothetical protein